MTLRLVLLAAGCTAAALGQNQPAPAASRSFEVASIKPSEPGRPGKAFTFRGAEFVTINTSVDDLIKFAYGVHSKQITGAPGWVESENFDIVAKPEGEGRPQRKQLEAMMQKLLADRLKLTFHREPKELAVFAITVGKNGPKMKKSESDIVLPSLFFRGPGVLPAKNATMGDFAGLLQSAVMDRPVVDKTGLSGRFDFDLNWTPDETQFGGQWRRRI